MNTEYSLTANAITRMLGDQFVSEPILQVLAYKQLPAGQLDSAENSGPRYRLLISDGQTTHQNCIVANQELVQGIRTGQFEKFTVIKLINYTLQQVRDGTGFERKLIYAINIQVLKPGSEVRKKLGSLPDNQETRPAMQDQQRQPQANLQQQQFNNGANNFQNQQQAPPPQANNVYSNGANNYQQQQQPPINPYAGYDNDFQQQKIRQPPQQQPSMQQWSSPQKTNIRPVMPTTPSSRAISDQAVIDIASITPYIGKWVIKARVTSKSGIRTWSNAKGEGKLFSFSLADKTGELKVSAFNTDCDKWFSFIEPNKVYYLSRAQIKAANKRYTNAEYECTLNSDSIIEECMDVKANLDVPLTRYNFVSIGSLSSHPLEQPVDIIGIIESVGEYGTIISKTKNKELKKRNITIVDMTRHDISVTIWGEAAETFTGQIGQVFVSKGSRLGDFGGRSLSAGDTILIDPDLPETRKMKNWYSNLMDSNFTHLTSSQDNQSSSTEWKPLKIVTDLEQFKQQSNTAAYNKVKATILMVGQRPIYKCCPTENCGKKLQDAPNGDLRCEKCQQTHTICKHRYKADIQISDATSTTWITLWDDKAEGLLGQKPEELYLIMQQDKEKDRYEKIMQAPNFKTFIFTIKSSLNTYNNEERLRHTVLGISPCDFVSYGKKLVDDIKLMSQSL